MFKRDPKKRPVFFHLKKHSKAHSLFFLWKIYYKVKSKISSTLHFLIKQNEQQQTLKDLNKRKEYLKQFKYILLVIFFSSVKSVYFNQFFCLLCIQTFSDVGTYQTIYWKNKRYSFWTSRACRYTWRKTAEVVWEWLFSVCCAHACQALPLTCELTNNTWQKQRWSSFLYPKFWMS